MCILKHKHNLDLNSSVWQLETLSGWTGSLHDFWSDLMLCMWLKNILRMIFSPYLDYKSFNISHEMPFNSSALSLIRGYGSASEWICRIPICKNSLFLDMQCHCNSNSLFIDIIQFHFLPFILLLIGNDRQVCLVIVNSVSLELRWFADLYCCITDVSWCGNLANMMSFLCSQISFKGSIDTNNIVGLDPNS